MVNTHKRRRDRARRRRRAARVRFHHTTAWLVQMGWLVEVPPVLYDQAWDIGSEELGYNPPTT